jgi:long-chain acyl-CoA synthetase
VNLAENLERSAYYFPDHLAIIHENRKFLYLELNREANRVATALIKLGIQNGDHVVLCAPNSYEWLAFYFGVLKAGAVAVTLPSTLTKSELAHLLDDARPRVLFTVDEKLDGLGDRRDRPYMDKVISAGGDISYPKLIEIGSASFKALDLYRKNTAAILYTGGTTGTPKGVMLTHENIKSSVHNVCHFERSNEEDRALCFLPPNHIFA